MTVIQRLPEIVYPMVQVNKVNEIVDVINEAINSSYSEENPVLNPVDGTCTWTVTHNLGTQNISCTVFSGDVTVVVPVNVISDNVITVSINSSSSISAKTYKVVVIAQGSVSPQGGGSSSEMEIKTYFVQGQLCDDNYSGTTYQKTKGYGNCTVTLYGSQKAMIEYTYTITSRYTSSRNVFWGINPSLISEKNSEIPLITPILGGSAFFYRPVENAAYEETAITTAGMNGYGGSNVPVTDENNVTRWCFGRLYDLGKVTEPPTLWYPMDLADYDVIRGVCWGTIS